MGEHGSKHWAAKITEDDVRAMRQERSTGKTFEAIYLAFGPKLGLSFSQVERILRGESWKHVSSLT